MGVWCVVVGCVCGRVRVCGVGVWVCGGCRGGGGGGGSVCVCVCGCVGGCGGCVGVGVCAGVSLCAGVCVRVWEL